MHTESIISHRSKCPSCENEKIISDDIAGESICKNCGFVISENKIDSENEWRSFTGSERKSTRVGDRTSLLFHDMGLSTVISKINHDGTGKPLSSIVKNSFNRLRIHDNRIRASSTSDKNLMTALSEMNNLKIKLSLSEPILEFAAYMYRKVADRGLVRGRTVKGMVGACVYLCCRNSEISRA